jgi:putative ABC transport system permease protein
VSRLGPPLRIAWRIARRSPGRTILIGALVGIPVVGAAFADTVVRTQNLTPSVRATRALGAADAELTVTAYDRIEGSDGSDVAMLANDAPSRDPRTVRPLEFLPPGSRIVRAPRPVTAAFTLADRRVVTDAAEVDTADPITAGLYAVRAGRLPARAGEVALTPGLAGRLGAAVGDTLRPDRGAPLTVVGLMAQANCRPCDIAVGLPGWAGPPAAGSDDVSIDYLVDWPAPTGTEADLVASLAEHGIGVRLRDSILHPERYRTRSSGGTATGVALLIIGIGLLEVLLLAGAAFAVGARRQVRDAAMVLANGGRRADVRRMVLAQAVVLGLLGSVAGAVLGVALVLAGWRWLQDWTLADFGGLVVSPRDLLLLIAVQVLVSVLAAVIPAIGAGRVPVLAGLNGRYGRPPVVRRRWQAAAGAGLVAGGLGVALWSADRWRADRMPQPGVVPNASLHAAGVLLGVALATIGLALSATGLLGLLGRVAHRLPLSARMAVRDAARHRHRTGPAVAAVMVAVTGSVALAQVVAGYDAHDRIHYVADYPIGAALVTARFTPEAEQRTDPDLLSGAHAAAAQLPATGEHPVWLLAGPGDTRLDVAPDSPPHCDSPIGGTYSGVSTATDLAELQLGPAQAARARAALAAGQAVVTTDCLVGGSTVKLSVEDKPLAALPAVVVLATTPYWRLPTVFVSDRTAARLGLHPYARDVLVTTDRIPTKGEVDKARGVVGGAEIDVERGYGRPYLPGLIALIAAAALVTLGGVAISVSLTAAEGRADLATLAAVGASPRRRRALAGWQAAVVAGLGVLLGGALGTVTGQLVLHSVPEYPITPPWPVLGAICVAVPLLGVLVVTATTRSRLPMGRRLG